MASDVLALFTCTFCTCFTPQKIFLHDITSWPSCRQRTSEILHSVPSFGAHIVTTSLQILLTEASKLCLGTILVWNSFAFQKGLKLGLGWLRVLLQTFSNNIIMIVGIMMIKFPAALGTCNARPLSTCRLKLSVSVRTVHVEQIVSFDNID